MNEEDKKVIELNPELNARKRESEKRQEKIRKLMGEAEPVTENQPKRDFTKPLVITSLVLVVGALMALMISRIGDYNSNNQTTTNVYKNIFQSENNPHPQLRYWSELSDSEKAAIKAEAIARFPEIKNIGQRVNWKPVNEWMAKEKGVTHNNVRDLFRDR